MRHFNKILMGVAMLGMVTSCVEHEPLLYEVEKPESIAVLEKINELNDLRSYVDAAANPNFKVGTTVSRADYMAKGLLYRVISRNFDEITLSAGMMHGQVVTGAGVMNVDPITEILSLANEAGITVHGNALASNRGVNAGYLNGLLAPLVVTSPPYANDLDISGLQDGSLSGWSFSNSSISVVDNEGMGSGVKAVKFVAGQGVSTPESLRLTSPLINVVEGRTYEILCYIKSDVPGQGRISFDGLRNNTPTVDWMGTGSSTETFSTTSSWQEIRFQVSDFEGESFKLNVDLGYVDGVNYYLDINNFYVFDTQGEPLVVNLIDKGDFEDGAPAWGGWGNNSTRGLTAEGQGYGNTGFAFWVTNPTAADFWAAQSVYTFAEPLEDGETYVLSFWVRGDGEGVIKPELQSANYSSNGFGDVIVTDQWKHIELTTTATAADRTRFIISYGTYLGTVYMDDFVIRTNKSTGGSMTFVEKLPEEKTTIVGNAFSSWITEIVSTTSEFINSWNVVNEPMDDANPSEIKSGLEKSDIAADEFYWQDYMGKDYAVEAFKLAREHGKEGDILYITESGLVNNLEKAAGLIEYVSYIESKGAKVDGIGVKMNINLESDKDNIVNLFNTLAASGKIIKVSELELGLGINAEEATVEHYKAQSDMYQFVVAKYFELIPAAQRGGITITSPSDRGQNHTGLWSESFNRKRAYVGFINGLSGNNVVVD
jgi:endo-1,4-beta-xylanase